MIVQSPLALLRVSLQKWLVTQSYWLLCGVPRGVLNIPLSKAMMFIQVWFNIAQCGESDYHAAIWWCCIYIVYKLLILYIVFFTGKISPRYFRCWGGLCPHKKKKDLGSQKIGKCQENLKIGWRHSPAPTLPFKHKLCCHSNQKLRKTRSSKPFPLVQFCLIYLLFAINFFRSTFFFI